LITVHDLLTCSPFEPTSVIVKVLVGCEQSYVIGLEKLAWFPLVGSCMNCAFAASEVPSAIHTCVAFAVAQVTWMLVDSPSPPPPLLPPPLPPLPPLPPSLEQPRSARGTVNVVNDGATGGAGAATGAVGWATGVDGAAGAWVWTGVEVVGAGVCRPIARPLVLRACSTTTRTTTATATSADRMMKAIADFESRLRRGGFDSRRVGGRGVESRVVEDWAVGVDKGVVGAAKGVVGAGGGIGRAPSGVVGGRGSGSVGGWNRSVGVSSLMFVSALAIGFLGQSLYWDYDRALCKSAVSAAAALVGAGYRLG
jgi:hypothetical protein